LYFEHFSKQKRGLQLGASASALFPGERARETPGRWPVRQGPLRRLFSAEQDPRETAGHRPVSQYPRDTHFPAAAARPVSGSASLYIDLAIQMWVPAHDAESPCWVPAGKPAASSPPLLPGERHETHTHGRLLLPSAGERERLPIHRSCDSNVGTGILPLLASSLSAGEKSRREASEETGQWPAVPRRPSPGKRAGARASSAVSVTGQYPHLNRKIYV
jgi:hypothetical protein